MAPLPTIEVLIIGAGPTGVMLALELALQGVSFRIIDSCPERLDKSRALVMHPRSLELVSRHKDAISRLIPRGYKNPAMCMYANRKFVFEIDFESIEWNDTEHKSSLIVSQAETEHVLDEVLAEYGHPGVERPVEAVKLEQDEEGITVWLKNGNGREEKVRCRYVVGCDGAHSIVRKTAGIKFEGTTYAQDFILADVHMAWNLKQALHLFMANGFMGAFPMKDGIWRLMCSRPDHANSDKEPTLTDFQEAVDNLFPKEANAKLFDPVWMARFRLHHRIADNYRKGRLFLAGDAAHIHSPAGGQGMNTGIQDAVNLGWKLGAVLRGEMNDSFLDTYNLERHKIGEYLLKGTDRIFETMASTNPAFLFIRNTLVPWIMPRVMSSPERRAARFRFVSQLGIRYRHSPIVGQASAWKGKLRGGDRAPNKKLRDGENEASFLGLLTGPGHHLLLFSGVGGTAVNDAVLAKAETDFLEGGSKTVEVHRILNLPSPTSHGHIDEDGTVHELYGFKEPGYAMIRPDGYISFIGPLTAMNELKVWLKAGPFHAK